MWREILKSFGFWGKLNKTLKDGQHKNINEMHV